MQGRTPHLSLTTTSAGGTRRAGSLLARKIAGRPSNRAYVIALTGGLGAGKTTFVQGFARALGVKAKIQSPTFVLMKIYALEKQKSVKHLAHIDAYRIERPAELANLGFRDLLKDRDGVIIIEWADRVRTLLPKGALWITFRHGEKAHQRIVEIKGGKRNMQQNGLL